MSQRQPAATGGIAKLVRALKQFGRQLKARRRQSVPYDPAELRRTVRVARKLGQAYRRHSLELQQLVRELHQQGEKTAARKLFRAVHGSLVVKEKAHVLQKRHLPLAGSFRLNLALQEERGYYSSRKLGVPGLRALCRKIPAYRFASELGVAIPEVYQEGEPLKDIRPRPVFVLKPMHYMGAVGVCGLVERGGQYQDIFREQGGSWKAVTHNLSRIAAKKGFRDLWMTEELILRSADELLPSDDFKFYMFYGVVGCILHIRRWPEREYQWYGPDWQPLATGKYAGSLAEHLSPPMAWEALEQAAKRLSENIPEPFVRVDLLSDGKRAVLNELTPAPGNYDQFSDRFDALLGRGWVDAEVRLKLDLVTGKRFDEYRRVLGLEGTGRAAPVTGTER